MTLYNFFTTPVKYRDLLVTVYKELLSVCEKVEIVQAGDTSGAIYSIMGQVYEGKQILRPAQGLNENIRYYLIDVHNPYNHNLPNPEDQP